MTMTSASTKDALKDILDSPWKRLNHLYWQIDKDAKRFKFRPNISQREFYRDMWYLNIYLKARQKGITTAILLFMLDRCLFNENTQAGVIAHNREDAQNFFKKKLVYAYNNLPEAVRATLPASTERAGELAFSNGSSIRVGTSMRSDTLQYLHISEFGKICAKFPDRAAEIISGSLNTVPPGQFIFIESTAEGAYGKYYDMCRAAEKKSLAGDELTKMDYKFFFFPWWDADEYRLEGPDVPVPPDIAVYFEMLEDEYGIKLDRAQKNWFVKKSEEQGQLMGREYPSIPEDAFRAVVEGAVFGKQLMLARKQRRIHKNIPWEPGIPVNTFWDLGRNDSMVIWFHQRVGPENRFIDYIEDRGHSMQHYIRILLNEKPYTYGKHYMPHDVGVTDLTQNDNLTRKEVAEQAGLRDIVPVDRIPSKEEAHELARQALASCHFSEEGCQYTPVQSLREEQHSGIVALENYRYEYDEKRQGFSKVPVDNKFCHGADAFMQFAQAYNPRTSESTGGGHVGMF